MEDSHNSQPRTASFNSEISLHENLITQLALNPTYYVATRWIAEEGSKVRTDLTTEPDSLKTAKASCLAETEPKAPNWAPNI